MHSPENPCSKKHYDQKPVCIICQGNVNGTWITITEDGHAHTNTYTCNECLISDLNSFVSVQIFIITWKVMLRSMLIRKTIMHSLVLSSRNIKLFSCQHCNISKHNTCTIHIFWYEMKINRIHHLWSVSAGKSQSSCPPFQWKLGKPRFPLEW